jgi:hypothetical protein
VNLTQRIRNACSALPENPKPDQVVTLVVHAVGVIDMAWKPAIGKWTLLRVSKNFIR